MIEGHGVDGPDTIYKCVWRTGRQSSDEGPDTAFEMLDYGPVIAVAITHSSTSTRCALSGQVHARINGHVTFQM